MMHFLVLIPAKPDTDSGVIRTVFGAKRRWSFIILPTGRNESESLAAFDRNMQQSPRKSYRNFTGSRRKGRKEKREMMISKQEWTRTQERMEELEEKLESLDVDTRTDYGRLIFLLTELLNKLNEPEPEGARLKQ